jgi:hypothetical protein
MSKSKKMKFVSEPIQMISEDDVKPYVPLNIKGPKEAYVASLHMLFNHVAEFHVTMIEILSEKYKIPVQEMLETVTKDPRYKSSISEPIVNTMGYVETITTTTTTTTTNTTNTVTDTTMDSITEKMSSLEVAQNELPELPEPPKIIRKKKILKVTTTA